MKKVLIYVLFICYTTSLFKPVVPYISDFLAHTFWAYEHISTVHFEHGKYHTHFESLELAKKTDPEKNTNSSKTEIAANDCIIQAISYCFTLQFPLKENLPFISPSYYSRYLSNETPPPKA